LSSGKRKNFFPPDTCAEWQQAGLLQCALEKKKEKSFGRDKSVKRPIHAVAGKNAIACV
jgi:hypothetical protein